MNFRVVPEIEVSRKVVKHVYGRCLLCDRETEYGAWAGQLGIVWLRKQFDPKEHGRNQTAVRIGVARKDKSLGPLESLLCPNCQAGLPKLREEHSAEREAALRMRALRSERYDARMKAMLALESYSGRFPGRGVC